MKFEALLTEYYNLLEQDVPDNTVQQTTSPVGQPQAGETPPPAAPAAPIAPVEPASPSYSYLVNVIQEALKTKQIINMDDMKFSNNEAKSSNEAYQYLNIVIRNLPTQTQQKLKQGFQKAGNFSDIDEGNLVDMANIAMKALFYNGKKENNTEYMSLSSTPLTPENAKKIFESITRLLA